MSRSYVCHVVEEDTREVCVRETILRHHWESVPSKGQRLHVPLRRRKRFLRPFFRRRRGIREILVTLVFLSLSLSLSFHPMYRHIVRTLFNTHCFVNASSIFVNREKERERNFSFDTSPWRSISPSTRLFSFHCSFILFALLSGPN